MRIPSFSRKKWRVFIVIYINPYTSIKKINGNPNFFTFRINSKNWKPFPRKITNWGFEVNAVYLSAVNRQTGNKQQYELYKRPKKSTK